VVDDEPHIRTLLCDFLKREGFEARSVPDGPSGLSALDTEPYDAIFVDMQMPGMTGLEMVATVRNRDPEIPIALMTAAENMLGTKGMVHTGINRIFVKPFSLSEIANWLRSLSF
jgi:DNA-binding response OmpR family regulator